MAELDHSFKIAAHNNGRELCWLRGVRPDVWEPISDTVQTTERLADRAFRAQQNGVRFVVYFEAYTAWRNSFRWNILAKSGLLSEREQAPTRTFVFILTEEGYHDQGGTFRAEVEGEATQQIWFREVCLWRERPEPWWEQVPGLMAMLPLCAHGRPPEEAVTFAAQRITAQVTDPATRGDLLTSLGFFGRLAYPALPTFSLIGRENMRESPFYHEIAAVERMEEKRADILEALTVRFGADAAAEFTQPLNGISDKEQLSELFRTAVKCRGIGAFRRALRSYQP
jgi:hypothetical protein